MKSDNVQKCLNVYLSLEGQEQMCKSVLENIVDNIHNEKTSKDESLSFSEKHKVNVKFFRYK